MSLPIVSFADTHRHTTIIGLLYSRYIQKYEDNNLYETHFPFKDNTALVFEGNRTGVLRLSRLFSSAEFETYPERLNLNTVEPDFMLFRDNKFLCNKNQTRILGQPDLLVEIWSKANDDKERAFKQHLYSTSDVTEHWYIEQQSNTVERYIGDVSLQSQSLKKILITQNGIEFDLRRLAIK